MAGCEDAAPRALEAAGLPVAPAGSAVPAALRAGASPAAASRGCPGKEPAGTGLWPKEQDGQDVPELGGGLRASD